MVAESWAVVSVPSMAIFGEGVARWIGAGFDTPFASMPEATRALADWSHRAGLPALTALGIGPEAQTAAAEAAATSSSMKANPVALTENELRRIMEEAC